MVIQKQESISLLLKNFIEARKSIEMVFLYSRDGLLISKYGKVEIESIDQKEIEEVHGAISSLVDELIDKMSMEYNIGSYGTGTFDTPDHRIIFIEAGPEALLLCVSNYDTALDELFPIAFLVAEKIAQLLENSFDYDSNSLDLPNLSFSENLSLDLDFYSVKEDNYILDKVKLKHQIDITKNRIKVFKLIILGSQAVGKTTLVNSFLRKHQFIDYRPTIGISISSQKYYFSSARENVIRFMVYDLAGQSYFRRVRHEYYKGANCAFIVYDITRRDTFEEAINFWLNDAKKELGNIPFVLIGNKIDLDNQREVSKEEGLESAKNHSTYFIETSALNNINVQDTFKLVGIGLFFKTKDDL